MREFITENPVEIVSFAIFFSIAMMLIARVFYQSMKSTEYDLDETYSALKYRRSRYRAVCSERDNLQAAKRKAEGQVRELQNQVEILTNSLNQSKESHKQATKKITQMGQENKALGDALDSQQKRIDDLGQELYFAEEKIARHEDQIEKAVKERDEAQDQLKAVTGKINQITDTIEQSNRNIIQYRAKVQDLSDDLCQLLEVYPKNTPKAMRKVILELNMLLDMKEPDKK